MAELPQVLLVSVVRTHFEEFLPNMLHLLLAIYFFKTILGKRLKSLGTSVLYEKILMAAFVRKLKLRDISGVSEPFSNAPPKKYFCTDTTQSVIPLKILRPDQEIGKRYTKSKF